MLVGLTTMVPGPAICQNAARSYIWVLTDPGVHHDNFLVALALLAKFEH